MKKLIILLFIVLCSCTSNVSTDNGQLIVENAEKTVDLEKNQPKLEINDDLVLPSSTSNEININDTTEELENYVPDSSTLPEIIATEEKSQEYSSKEDVQVDSKPKENLLQEEIIQPIASPNAESKEVDDTPNNPSDKIEETENKLYVNMEIKYNTETLVNGELEIVEDTSVFDVLIDLGKENNIPIDYTGSGKSIYIQGINSIYEFDEGPMSGWIYTVNEEEPSISCSAYKLSGGEKIVWEYTK